MPKVFITRRISPEAIDLLKQHFEVGTWQEDEALSREELSQKLLMPTAWLSGRIG